MNLNLTDRMRRGRQLAALACGIAVVVGLALSAAPASAAPASASARSTVVRVEHASYAPIRQSVKQFLDKATRTGVKLPATVRTELARPAAALTCWYWNDWRKASNIWGATVWQYNVEPNWCGDGTWIRSYAYTNTWASNVALGWSFQRNIQSIDRYGVNWNVFEAIRQGHFCLIAYFSCVQNSYPYVDVEVGGGGQIYKS